jgi:hypothetical protein
MQKCRDKDAATHTHTHTHTHPGVVVVRLGRFDGGVVQTQVVLHAVGLDLRLELGAAFEN